MWACHYGHKDVVKLLLDYSEHHSIDFNVKEKMGKTAFLLACRNGDKDVVQLLLDHSGQNIELNAVELGPFGGKTAFIWACAVGNKDIVQLLLNHSERIELNVRGNDGYTALMQACQFGRKDVVKLLLDHSEQRSIDLNVKNKHKMTAFMCALKQACLDGQPDVVRLFLEHSNPSIDLNVSDRWCRTWFLIASKRGHQNIVQWITEKLKTVNNDNQAAEVPNPKQ